MRLQVQCRTLLLQVVRNDFTCYSMLCPRRDPSPGWSRAKWSYETGRMRRAKREPPPERRPLPRHQRATNFVEILGAGLTSRRRACGRRKGRRYPERVSVEPMVLGMAQPAGFAPELQDAKTIQDSNETDSQRQRNR